MTQKNYFNFHIHSHYSLLDGLSKPDNIVKRLQELGQSGSAITDHGNLFGSVKFLQKMTKANLKPIIGIEFYICDQDATVQDNTNRHLSHLLLYAKNNQGWKTLLKIVAEANKPEHYYYKPRLSVKQLAPLLDGNIIGICGHLGSTLSHLILDDNKDVTYGVKLAKRLQELFKGQFYLEGQLYDTNVIPESKILTDMMREISKKSGIKMIPTNDAHYCKPEDAFDQRILLCRNLNQTLDQVQKSGALSSFFQSNKFYIPSYDEMLGFGFTEEELDNTNQLASEFEPYTNILKPPSLPVFDCPEGYNPDSWLKELARKGWREKIQNKIPKEQHQTYIDRFNHEFSVIQEAGLSSYFLTVANILDYVRESGWLQGIARGSSAGCLVSYLINITKVDPLKYDLLFERFYNSARKGSLPDIDIDVPIDCRNSILEYIRKKYGESRVSSMVTFQKLHGRSALKDTLRAYGNINFETMNNITSFFPEPAKVAGEIQLMQEETGESSLIRYTLEKDQKTGKLREWAYIDDNGNVGGVLAKRFIQAMALEGTPFCCSKHPAGVIIAPDELNNIAPLHYDTGTKSCIIGLDMTDCENIGLVKLDVLGLAVLDKISLAQQILRNGV